MLSVGGLDDVRQVWACEAEVSQVCELGDGC
jgi:hypothetical protein